MEYEYVNCPICARLVPARHLHLYGPGIVEHCTYCAPEFCWQCRSRKHPTEDEE